MAARPKMILHVGFTGTQQGMTAEQMLALERGLAFWRDIGKYDLTGHHGDCIGADAEFHAIMKPYQTTPPVIHPPDNPSKRAFCEPYSSMMPPLPYLERNRSIVRNSDRLIGCPKSFTEELRSGTWSTLRYALKHPGYASPFVIWPDGSIEAFASSRF
jgi:hypothetical protein